MTDSWNDYADSWDDNSDARYYSTQAFATLDAFCGLTSGRFKAKRVLDFGCGTGLLCEKIAPHVNEVVAVDTSDRMIAVLEAKALPNVRAIHGDILDGPSEGSDAPHLRFDLVCASSVCGFLPDYLGAVARLAELLNPGGIFIQWDWKAVDDSGFGLTEQMMRDALQNAGLQEFHFEQAFEVATAGQVMPVLMAAGQRL